MKAVIRAQKPRLYRLAGLRWPCGVGSGITGVHPAHLDLEGITKVKGTAGAPTLWLLSLLALSLCTRCLSLIKTTESWETLNLKGFLAAHT